MSTTTTIPRGQLKGAIIQYAMAYVEKNGYKDLNLDTVSRDLNVSHGAPYRHFKTKTDLLASLAYDGFNDLADTQTEFLSRHPEGSRDQLIALSEAYVDFLVRRERLYDVMWDFTWTPDINQETAAAGRRTFLIHIGAIKSYIDTQGLDPELQDEMAMNVWAFLHGLAVLALHKEAIVKPTPERLNMLVRSGMNAMLDGYDQRRNKNLH
ncbi:TetR/AcrR family transcriptional regulator [Orrella daihaiensis]|uniref:TetR/AcrR family transcriptional regulator n=1 Tax=Orrella daihaiensis TaxID=2782176 RepID=A0ABY4AL89_9BURK|nr:TetR/AcrR family transcriptional regulator [Orrella daihaiensis]UOD51075.1 TetR/AcrR family transcriptional regulator [Orrella daihaiensis]